MVKGSKKLTVAQYLEQQMALSDKSQKEIAAEIGYDKPNVITMIKQGATKLPINKVGPMAKALNVDPVHLLRLTMGEYMPDTWASIEELIGHSLVSKEELALLKLIRKAAGGQSVDLSYKSGIEKLEEAVKEVVEAQNADYDSAVRATKVKRVA